MTKVWHICWLFSCNWSMYFQLNVTIHVNYVKQGICLLTFINMSVIFFSKNRWWRVVLYIWDNTVFLKPVLTGNLAQEAIGNCDSQEEKCCSIAIYIPKYWRGYVWSH